MEAPDYLALRQVCLAKVRGGYRPALGMFPCVLDYGGPPRSHLHTPRVEMLKIDPPPSVRGLGAAMFPSAGPEVVTGSVADGALYVIMRRNPTGIDDRNPALESASFSSGIIFPGFQLQSQGGRRRTWGTSYVGQTQAKVDNAKAVFMCITFATLNVSQSARTSSLEFYSSSHVPALLGKVGQASTRALLF